jgi:hypothetical protein
MASRQELMMELDRIDEEIGTREAMMIAYENNMVRVSDEADNYIKSGGEDTRVWRQYQSIYVDYEERHYKTKQQVIELNRRRQEILRQLRKTVPAKEIDIEFYTYGYPSSNRDRLLSVKCVVSMTVPEGTRATDIPNDLMLGFCNQAWDKVESEGHPTGRVDMGFEFSQISSKGIYRYDERQNITYINDDNNVFTPDGYTYNGTDYTED